MDGYAWPSFMVSQVNGPPSDGTTEKHSDWSWTKSSVMANEFLAIHLCKNLLASTAPVMDHGKAPKKRWNDLIQKCKVLNGQIVLKWFASAQLTQNVTLRLTWPCCSRPLSLPPSLVLWPAARCRPPLSLISLSACIAMLVGVKIACLAE